MEPPGVLPLGEASSEGSAGRRQERGSEMAKRVEKRDLPVKTCAVTVT